MKQLNGKKLQQLKSKSQGQGMTEYIIIVALIAVAAIGVYRFFGDTIRSQVSGLASEVAGQDSTNQITQAQTRAASARAAGVTQKTMGTYNQGNGGS